MTEIEMTATDALEIVRLGKPVYWAREMPEGLPYHEARFDQALAVLERTVREQAERKLQLSSVRELRESLASFASAFRVLQDFAESAQAYMQWCTADALQAEREGTTEGVVFGRTLREYLVWRSDGAKLKSTPATVIVLPSVLGWGTARVLSDIAKECARVVLEEKRTPETDDEYVDGVLANAAACYAMIDGVGAKVGQATRYALWPWSDDWWKPKTPERNLIRAGQLIVAEVCRRNRAKGT